MNFIWINRILIVLAAVGIFVAGFLTYTYLNHLNIPCGTASSCDFVASTPFAKVGTIPTPAFGLLAYTALFALAGLRTFLPAEKARKTVPIGFGIALLGAFASAFLMHILYNVLRTSCDWCLASAMIMFSTFGLYAWLASKEWEGLSKPMPDQILVACVLAASVIAVGLRTQGLTRTASQNIPEGWTVRGLDIPAYRFIGSKDAPVSIIEVADFYCDACRANAGYINELRQRYDDKIGIGFICLPLINKEGHEMSGLASVAAEITGEENKFWQFAEKMFSPAGMDIKDNEGVFALMESLGFDSKTIQDRLANSSDPAYKRFEGSFEAIRKLGIDRTPAFIFLEKGAGGLIVDKEGLELILGSPRVRQLLEHNVDDGHGH